MFHYARTATFALCFLPLLAPAQTPTEPPVYLRFLRTPGRPDLSLIHSYANAGTDVTVIAATSISGPQESWLFEAHESFADIEALDQKLNAETNARILIGLARNPAYAEAMTEGGASNRKLAIDTVISRENTLLRIQPSLSHVPPDFWAPASQ